VNLGPGKAKLDGLAEDVICSWEREVAWYYI